MKKKLIKKRLFFIIVTLLILVILFFLISDMSGVYQPSFSEVESNADMKKMVTPEPSTLILIGTGLFFLVRRIRRSKNHL